MPEPAQHAGSLKVKPLRNLPNHVQAWCGTSCQNMQHRLPVDDGCARHLKVTSVGSSTVQFSTGCNQKMTPQCQSAISMCSENQLLQCCIQTLCDLWYPVQCHCCPEPPVQCWSDCYHRLKASCCTHSPGSCQAGCGPGSQTGRSHTHPLPCQCQHWDQSPWQHHGSGTLLLKSAAQTQDKVSS